MRFMDNAVRFERESNSIRVKYVLSIDGIELRTVLEALDVSESRYLLFLPVTLDMYWSCYLNVAVQVHPFIALQCSNHNQILQFKLFQ